MLNYTFLYTFSIPSKKKKIVLAKDNILLILISWSCCSDQTYTKNFSSSEGSVKFVFPIHTLKIERNKRETFL